MFGHASILGNRIFGGSNQQSLISGLKCNMMIFNMKHFGECGTIKYVLFYLANVGVVVDSLLMPPHCFAGQLA